MPEPLLAARSITKQFPGVRALDGVDFTVRAGEIHALLGENGAGKSTLIKVLTGVHPADGGTITLAGKQIHPHSPHDAEVAGISTVYQEVNLIPSLSVAENIALGRQPGRFGFVNWKAARRHAREALERLEIHCDVDAELGTLSLALQQMVAIARALDVKARVLVLDEPTASLDEKEVAELFSVMRRLKASGMGIVFVTHFLDQVYAVSDRITVLRNGALVGEFEAAALPKLKLVSHMLGREIKQEDHAPGATATSDAAIVLDAKGITRRGGVEPVNITLRKGEVAGLAGLLGSGRTETARLLFGIDGCDGGSIRLGDTDVTGLDPRKAVKSGMAFCSEDRKAEGILPNLSVRENIIIALQAKIGAFKRLSRQQQEDLCNQLVASLRIKTADLETPIRNLSGGNQQKVLLARWLATKPILLILDEPTRGIDIGAKQEIENLVGKLRSEGLAVLFISSEIEEVVRTCNRVTVLRERRACAEFAGDDIKLNTLLRAMAGQS